MHPPLPSRHVLTDKVIKHRHTDIQSYKHTYRHNTYRHTDIQTYRHTDMQTDRHTDIQTYRNILPVEPRSENWDEGVGVRLGEEGSQKGDQARAGQNTDQYNATTCNDDFIALLLAKTHARFPGFYVEIMILELCF